LLPEFAGKDSAQQAQQKGYPYFLKVKKEHIGDSIGRNRDIPGMMTTVVYQLTSADSILRRAINKQTLYVGDIVSFQPADSIQTASKKYILDLYTVRKTTWEGVSLGSAIRSARESLATAKKNQLLYAGVKSDPLALRKEIVGDNPFDINDRDYGNNIVGDEYADHGSHCSCIIAADRKDGIGIDGIADNVIILPVRAVNTLHYGDEMDKDISLAIRYAVDNGARIISMSFGKDLSPQKQWVDDAIRYAETKGVLLVHAAGNDGENIDSADNFPSPYYGNAGARVNNFITVGAMSSDTGASLPAQFSNYSHDKVDLFAPGVAIYSCIPGNKYASFSGTSMATPAVAGVAALLLEYYPQLTAVQVKDILMKSVTSLKGKMVNKPGSKEKVDFGALSVSGGVVNAYNALLLADKMVSK
jgi:cell wall-associated protease